MIKRQLEGDKTETLYLNNYCKDFGYKGKFKSKARLETERVHFRRQVTDTDGTGDPTHCQFFKKVSKSAFL